MLPGGCPSSKTALHCAFLAVLDNLQTYLNFHSKILLLKAFNTQQSLMAIELLVELWTFLSLGVITDTGWTTL